MKLLIIGCGRSGTGYSSKFFSISHESEKNLNGLSSWSAIVGYYRPFFNSQIINNLDQYENIFHQIRHPLRVIESWLMNYKSKDREEIQFFRAYIPEIFDNDSLIIQFSKYWYYWNLKCEERASLTYQVEQIHKYIPFFEEKLNIKIDHNDLPTDINKYINYDSSLTWIELKSQIPNDLYDKIYNLSLKYGYN